MNYEKELNRNKRKRIRIQIQKIENDIKEKKEKINNLKKQLIKIPF